MYFRKKTSGGRAYLQIVESRREGAAVRQQVIATLGRVEDLRESRLVVVDPAPIPAPNPKAAAPAPLTSGPI